MSTSQTKPDTITFNCRAILSDLDGTLIDSEHCVDYAWQVWAESRNLDVEYIMANAHGRRTVDSVRLLTPHLDLDTEVAYLEELEVSCTRDMIPIPGTRKLFDLLIEADLHKHLAIVTSGSRKLATHRLTHVGFTIPRVFVTADDITQGKPHPEGYISAARALGLEPNQCVALEDSPAGIHAAKQAGAKVIAISFKAGDRDISEADCVIHDLTQIDARFNDDGITLIVTPNKK